MKILRWVSVSAVALLLLLGPKVSSAAFLLFREEGDQVFVVVDNNFECGVTFTTNGENAHVDACWFTNSPNGYSGVADAYMVEPAGTPDGGTVSDQIHIQFDVSPGPAFNVAHMVADFISDSEGAPPRFPPPGVQGLPEDGTPQLINFFFFDTAGNQIQPPANIEMRAQSDVEIPTPVRPSTWGSIKALYR